jgi:hypothetical protein
MDATTNADKITEWLNQQVDVAFGPLLEKIAQDGTSVQWEKDDFLRALRLQFGAGEITYTITLDPDSDPVAGQLLFKTPEAESRKPFSPALRGDPQAPGEMTGSDLVNDLIEQFGQWCKRQAATRLHL